MSWCTHVLTEICHQRSKWLGPYYFAWLYKKISYVPMLIKNNSNSCWFESVGIFQGSGSMQFLPGHFPQYTTMGQSNCQTTYILIGQIFKLFRFDDIIIFCRFRIGTNFFTIIITNSTIIRIITLFWCIKDWWRITITEFIVKLFWKILSDRFQDWFL